MPKTNKKTVEKTKKVVNNETNIKKAKTLLTNNGIAIAVPFRLNSCISNI